MRAADEAGRPVASPAVTVLRPAADPAQAAMARSRRRSTPDHRVGGAGHRRRNRDAADGLRFAGPDEAMGSAAALRRLLNLT
ncbi:hypothetical protein GCM10009787_72790 [Streptomyces bangladeshensis]|uniref:Uncharacterized protein n=1 Tax=Streptomyces bangladeshensis TaxID=295352 RepID=A0ABP5P2E3_9ACTN